MQGAGADLSLGAPEREADAGVDACGQVVVVDEHAVAAQDVGDEVVGEDGEAVEVVELGDARQREVVGDDLGALVEAAVIEHRHAAREHLRQALGRAARFGNEVERASRLLACGRGRPAPAPSRPLQEAAQRAQCLRVEAHQLVVGCLVEDRGDLARAHLRQPRARGRAVRADVVGEAPRDREVAAHRRAACALQGMGGALAQRGEPARAEVDRVEREHVVGDVRRVPLQVVALGVERGRLGRCTSAAASRSMRT